jgi:hypothetical protein
MIAAEPRLLAIRAADPRARSLAGFYDVVGPDEPADIVMAPHTLMEPALADFRDRVIGDDSVQLLNVETLVERLTLLSDSAAAVPFVDEDGLLAIEMWTARGFDRIQIGSLCGDMLAFRPRPDREALQSMIEMLRRWTSISATAWMDTLYRSALKRLASNDAVTAFLARGGDGNLLVRVTALLAALRAWHGRAEESERRAAVADVAGTQREPDRRWHVPVDLLVSGAGPDRLSDFERELGLRYANEVLLWDGSEPAYPVWLLA